MPEAQSTDLNSRVRFGEFVLDSRRGLVSVKGYAVKLQPQPLRVLQLLVERAPAVVTRDELGDHVWGEGVHVELDASLNYCIRQIRLALRDSATEPRYVETLPKQGYRMVAAVERESVEDEALVESVPAVVPAPAMSRRRFVARAGLWTGGVAVAAGAGIWLDERWHRRARPSAIHVKVELLEGMTATGPSQLLGPPVVAPDGSAIAIALSAREGVSLYLRPLNDSRLAKMAGTEGGRFPFWSPDSRHIGFFADGKLKRVAADGGSVAVLCEAPEPRGGSWGSRGTILFAVDLYPNTWISQVPEQGGGPQPATVLDRGRRENSHRFPVFLPDGRRFLYYARSDDAENRGIYLARLGEGDAPRKVVVADGQFALAEADEEGAAFLLSPQAGKIVAQRFDVKQESPLGRPQVVLERPGQLSASNTGVLMVRTDAQQIARMVWRDREGRELATAAPADDYWGVALSPSGRYLAALRHDGNGEFRVWAGPLRAGQLEPLSEARHVVGMAWSADDTLHYSDYRTNTLYERGMAAGSVEVQERTLPPVCYIADYSADGRTAVLELTQDRARSQSVWTTGSNRGLNRVAGSGRFGVRPAISPNGRWMAFGSDERGVTEIYLTELPTATQRQRVSNGGGSRPRWRRDGRELFYLSGEGALMSVSVEAAGELHLGEPTMLFHTGVKGVPGEAPYDVSPDGERFVLLERMPGADPGGVEMVLNWPSLLGSG